MVTAYSKSKVLAERYACDFVKESEKNGQPCFELSTINPGYVMVSSVHFLRSFIKFYFHLRCFMVTSGSFVARFALYFDGNHQETSQ